MPVYQNITDGPLPFPGHEGRVEADDTATVGKYLSSIPAGFELIGHGESPWLSLHAAVLGDGVSLDDLAQYSQIIISNDTGAVVECVANGDTANPFPVMNGMSQPFVIANDVWSLDITGEGAGTLYVNAFRK